MTVKEVMNAYTGYDFAIEVEDEGLEYYRENNGLWREYCDNNCMTDEQVSDLEVKAIDLDGYEEEKIILMII